MPALPESSAGPSETCPVPETALRVGIAAGGGIEYGFTPNWSAKLEYVWIGAALNDAHLNTVRAGINYRFGAN